MKYSQSTRGFYDETIHTEIPADAVEIDFDTYQLLLAGQSNGQIIVPNVNGFPELANPPAPTTEEQAAAVRQQRDRLLTETDWVVVKALETSTVVPANYVTYRQELRDITLQAGFPSTVTWPVLA